MGKRDELIADYAAEISEKCGQTPDMDLLTKVTIGCGPSIYRADATLVAGSDPEELARIEKNFLMKKLGLAGGPELAQGIQAVIQAYGSSNPRKHRAVVYYLLTKHFGREAVYG